MPSYNQVTICGHATRDPEIKYVGPKSSPLCTFSVGVNEKRGDNETSTFIDVKCWMGTAEAVSSRIKKGDAVICVGKVATESWEDKATGQKRSKTLIVADAVGLALYQKKNVGEMAKAVHAAVDSTAPAKTESQDDSSIPF